MKNSLILIAALCSLFKYTHSQAQSSTITSFAELVQAVETGDNVRAIVHFNRCVLTRRGIGMIEPEMSLLNGAFTAIDSEGIRRPMELGGIRRSVDLEAIRRPLEPEVIRLLEGATTRFNFNHYFHARERIENVFIDTVSTSMNISVPQRTGPFLVLSGRLSIFEDNTASLHLNVADSQLGILNTELHWQCEISNGQDERGLVLFNFS